MRRDDPATWVPFSKEEAESYERPEGGGDPYFIGRGHRLYIRNGAEEVLLNTAPRALWGVRRAAAGRGGGGVAGRRHQRIWDYWEAVHRDSRHPKHRRGRPSGTATPRRPSTTSGPTPNRL